MDHIDTILHAFNEGCCNSSCHSFPHEAASTPPDGTSSPKLPSTPSTSSASSSLTASPLDLSPLSSTITLCTDCGCTTCHPMERGPTSSGSGISFPSSSCSQLDAASTSFSSSEPSPSITLLLTSILPIVTLMTGPTTPSTSTSPTPSSSFSMDQKPALESNLHASQIRRRTHLPHWMLLSMVMITLMTVVTGQSCPSICSCKWSGGKQHASCVNQNLINVPSGITDATQILILDDNNFQIIPARVFQERGLTNLQKIFLNKCKLGEINRDAFVQLSNLVELSLSSNLLTHIPSESFVHSPSIRRLVFANNPIRAIKVDTFQATPILNYLDLSDCQIELIEPGAFRGLGSLQYLKLEGNRLSTLQPEVILDLQPLYLLDLHRNPWNCDCNLKPAREWMIKYNVPQSVPPTCLSPEKIAGSMWNSLVVDEFACPPNIMDMDTEIPTSVGSNATITCKTRAEPEAKMSWSVEDVIFRNLSSPVINKGQKLSFEENRNVGPGMTSTSIIVYNVDYNDSGRQFTCYAENSAGIARKTFTMTVYPPGAGGLIGLGGNSWTKIEVACTIVGALFLILAVFVLAALLVVRSKRYEANGTRTVTSACAGGDGSSDGSSTGSTRKDIVGEGVTVGTNMGSLMMMSAGNGGGEISPSLFKGSMIVHQPNGYQQAPTTMMLSADPDGQRHLMYNDPTGYSYSASHNSALNSPHTWINGTDHGMNGHIGHHLPHMMHQGQSGHNYAQNGYPVHVDKESIREVDVLKNVVMMEQDATSGMMMMMDQNGILYNHHSDQVVSSTPVHHHNMHHNNLHVGHMAMSPGGHHPMMENTSLYQNNHPELTNGMLHRDNSINNISCSTDQGLGTESASNSDPQSNSPNTNSTSGSTSNDQLSRANMVPIGGKCVMCGMDGLSDLRSHYVTHHDIRECIV